MFNVTQQFIICKNWYDTEKEYKIELNKNKPILGHFVSFKRHIPNLIFYIKNTTNTDTPITDTQSASVIKTQINNIKIFSGQKIGQNKKLVPLVASVPVLLVLPVIIVVPEVPVVQVVLVR